MTVVFLRVLIIYCILSIVMRIMGKRQVGELEVSELISTLLLSEIAAMPIENPDLPLVYALIPLITVVCFEIIITYSKNKIPVFKKIFESKPTFLIKRGVLVQESLEKMRISIEELIGELRILGVADISDVDYAILEQNGKISMTLKPSKSPATVEDLKLSVEHKGIAHALVIDGRLNRYNMNLTSKNESWVLERIKKENSSLSEVFLMTIDDSGSVNIIKKRKKKKKK